MSVAFKIDPRDYTCDQCSEEGPHDSFFRMTNASLGPNPFTPFMVVYVPWGGVPKKDPYGNFFDLEAKAHEKREQARLAKRKAMLFRCDSLMKELNCYGDRYDLLEIKKYIQENC